MTAHLKYKSGSSWIDYNLVVYPVGAYYFSSSSTSPAELFGGTWSAVTERFLYMNAGTDVGGNNSYTLTVQQLPSHNHYIYDYQNGRMGAPTASGPDGVAWATHSNNTWNGRTGFAGAGAAINNMPAYQTVYAWRRTA